MRTLRRAPTMIDAHTDSLSTAARASAQAAGESGRTAAATAARRIVYGTTRAAHLATGPTLGACPGASPVGASSRPRHSRGSWARSWASWHRSAPWSPQRRLWMAAISRSIIVPRSWAARDATVLMRRSTPGATWRCRHRRSAGHTATHMAGADPCGARPLACAGRMRRTRELEQPRDVYTGPGWTPRVSAMRRAITARTSPRGDIRRGWLDRGRPARTARRPRSWR